MTRFDRPFGTMPDVHLHDRRGAGRGLPTSGIDLQAARPAFGHADQVPVGSFRFVALDVETACSDAASICQIGLACVQPDGEIQTFSMLVNPRSRFDSFNIRLHGIGPDHVAQAPGFAEALEMLLPLLTRHQLVQHSNFDKQAMNAACRTCGLNVPDLRWPAAALRRVAAGGRSAWRRNRPVGDPPARRKRSPAPAPRGTRPKSRPDRR